MVLVLTYSAQHDVPKIRQCHRCQYVTFLTVEQQYIHIHIHLYICTTSPLPSSIEGHLGYFHVLATMKNPAINIGVHISLCVFSLGGQILRRSFARSYGSSVLNFFFQFCVGFRYTAEWLDNHILILSIVFPSIFPVSQLVPYTVITVIGYIPCAVLTSS